MDQTIDEKLQYSIQYINKHGIYYICVNPDTLEFTDNGG